ncbi:MAG TPA: hypothetical protein VMN36_06470 [Verrucomicrobiales bacterium]|nr:hypothetical protein [Verrucomicrobiales bacterium]
MPAHPPTQHTGRVALSWPRRQWLRLLARIEDHPRTILLCFAALAAVFTFYGCQLRGFSHFHESFSRWRVHLFGGVHQVDRSVRVYDSVLSLAPFPFNRIDSTSLTALHVGGTAFRRELNAVVLRDQGRVRIILLDPRLGHPTHPFHPRFAAMAHRVGEEPYLFAAKCWHAAAAGIQLSDALGPGLEIRFLDSPLTGSEPPWFSFGSSTHLYHHNDPSQRLDVITPRPPASDQRIRSSFEDPSMVIHNRSSHPEVRRFHGAFNTLWEQAQPLDPTLRREFLRRLDHGETPIADQP